MTETVSSKIFSNEAAVCIIFGFSGLILALQEESTQKEIFIDLFILLSSFCILTLATIIVFKSKIKHQMKCPIIIHGERELLEKYHELKWSAHNGCSLIWCGTYTEYEKFEVERYFKDDKCLCTNAKSKIFKLTRYINPKTIVPEHKHIHDETLSSLCLEGKGHYHCKTCHITHYEIIHCDYIENNDHLNRSMLILLDGEQKPTVGFYVDDKGGIPCIEATKRIKDLFLHTSVEKYLFNEPNIAQKSFPENRVYEGPQINPELNVEIKSPPQKDTSVSYPLPIHSNSLGGINKENKYTLIFNQMVPDNDPMNVSDQDNILTFSQERWDIISEKYDKCISLTNNEIVKEYQNLEELSLLELVDKYLENSDPRDISLIEIGSGTGRFLQKFLLDLQKHESNKKLRKIRKIIGVDFSTKMIEKSKKKIKENNSLNSLIKNKVFFINEDAKNIDFEKFENNKCNIRSSRNIVFCMLNTLGIVLPEDRDAIIKKMLEISKNDGSVFISLYSSDAWIHARPIYSAMTDITGPIDENAFDDIKHEFQTTQYYTKWFSDQDITEIIERNKSSITPKFSKVIELGSIGRVIQIFSNKLT
ncbi:MAG: methyltransferase domain-containing protein [Methanoregula sp.]